MNPRFSFTWPDSPTPRGFGDLQSDLESLIHKSRTSIDIVAYSLSIDKDFILNKALNHVIKEYKPEIRIFSNEEATIDSFRYNYGGLGSTIRAWTWDKKGEKYSIMHVKSIVVNGRELYVGSANFSWTAMSNSAECGLFLSSKPMAMEIREYLNRLIDSGRLVEV